MPSGSRPRYSIYVAGDNEYKLWIDGVLVAEFAEGPTRDAFTTPRRVDLVLTPGVHRFCIQITNLSGPSANLAGAILAMFSQDTSGNDDTLVLRTNSSWKALDYPTDPPGFTLGKQLGTLVTEAQDDEATLLGWTLDCDDDVDAASNDWPTDREWSFGVGDTSLKVLRQLGETDIDFVVDPSTRTLHPYNIDTYGTLPGAATAVLDKLSSLRFSGQSDIKNTLLVRYRTGYTEVRDQDSVDIFGRRKGFLSLGDVESETEAQRLGTRELIRLAWPTNQISLRADPSASATAAVYTDYDLGDYVLTYGRGDLTNDTTLTDSTGDPLTDGSGGGLTAWSTWRVRQLHDLRGRARQPPGRPAPGLTTRRDGRSTRAHPEPLPQRPG